MTLLLDTGPFVAMLCSDDPHHRWAMDVLTNARSPLLTCDAVLSETCFVLRRDRRDAEPAFHLIERGIVSLAFNLGEEFAAVQALFTRYRNVPASLADACLVRMSEQHLGAKVMTLDSDFLIYRKTRSKPVPVLTPLPL